MNGSSSSADKTTESSGLKLTDLNRGCNITAIVGPVTYKYSLGHGEWFVPHDMRKHYGDELLDAVNKHEPYTLIKRGLPLEEQTINSVKFTKGNYLPKPTVGRIVQYRGVGYEEPLAAIITQIDKVDGYLLVSLRVFTPTDTFYVQNVGYSVSTPGCWSWPPRA